MRLQNFRYEFGATPLAVAKFIFHHLTSVFVLPYSSHCSLHWSHKVCMDINIPSEALFDFPICSAALHPRMGFSEESDSLHWVGLFKDVTFCFMENVFFPAKLRETINSARNFPTSRSKGKQSEFFFPSKKVQTFSSSTQSLKPPEALVKQLSYLGEAFWL